MRMDLDGAMLASVDGVKERWGLGTREDAVRLCLQVCYEMSKEAVVDDVFVEYVAGCLEEIEAGQ